MGAKDLLLQIQMEFRRSEILKITRDGEYPLRLVYPRGMENSSPFTHVKVHYGFLAYKKKNFEMYACAGKNCAMCAEHEHKKENGDLSAEKIRAKSKYHYLALWNGGFRIFEADWYLQRELLGIDNDSLGPLAKAISNGIDPFASVDGRTIIISKDSTNGLKYSLLGLSKENSLSALEVERLKTAPDIHGAYLRPSVLESQLIVAWTNKNKSQSKDWED